jgi:D-alanine-D-alanine ligase
MRIHILCNRSVNSDAVNLELFEERFETEESVDFLSSSLSPLGDISIIEANNKLVESLLEIKPDFVINIAEGYFGNHCNSYAPALLDNLRIPYFGLDSVSSSLCQDKSSTKTLLKYAKIPTPRGILISSLNDLKQKREFGFPVIVKPNCWRNGVGITERSIVESEADLKFVAYEILHNFSCDALIEEHIKGLDLYILVNEDKCFKPVLIKPKVTVCDVWYQKALDKISMEFTPSGPKANTLLARVHRVATDAYTLLGCRGPVIVDVRLGVDSVPYVLGVNRVSSFTPSSPAGIALKLNSLNVGDFIRESVSKVIKEHIKNDN